MVSKPFTVDLSKTVVFQVGHLGEAYEKWVNQPIVSKDGPRFFANDFCEVLILAFPFKRFTNTECPMTSFIIFLPFLTRTALDTYEMVGDPTSLATSSMLACLCLHPKRSHSYGGSFGSDWGNTLNYLLHGCHHKHPLDRLRLVFPPAATAILCVPVWTVFRLLSTHSTAPALFGGGLLGYVIYDCTHYYLHHGKPSKGYGHILKRYHLNHHFKAQNKGFGITSSIWDHVFGTFPASKVGET
ncbi:hypothetical protein V6N13_033993 [Hibiscus sabdariffa]